MLKARTSAGEAESFGMTQQSTQQMQADHAAAVKKGLNLAAVAGSLNWIALRSRPDISWAVSRAASLVSRDPSLAYHRFRHITQFLRWTIDYGLKYVPLQQQQRTMWWACADASFAPTGEASHEGVALVQGGSSQLQEAGNLVHWKSTRQSLISKSSCEAELLAL
eukprot:5445248-Amphidinium_carterae.1